jgi:hypothetical protein
MNGWLDQITEIMNKVAKDVNLPEVRGMFEGDSWIWTWRQWGEQVAEAIARIRPDVFGDGIEIGVSAGAWMPTKRHIAAGRTYYIKYIELKQIPYMQDSLTAELTNALRQAWQGAKEMAPRLHEVEQARSELMSKLRAMDLLK